MKKFLSVLLCLCMLCSFMPTGAFAAYEDGLCQHHTAHDPAVCGWADAEYCTHEHTAECYQQIQSCIHDHTVEGCTYVAAQEAKYCGHICGNGTCSYDVGFAGQSCSCDQLDEAGNIIHVENCGYMPAREAKGCDFQHVNCGCAAAVEAHYICSHSCSEQSGCITTSLNCGHLEDGSCCYAAGIPCAFVGNPCSDCAALLNSQQLQLLQNDAPTTAIADDNVSLDKSEYTYDGTEKKPVVTVVLNGATLTLETDYTVTYTNNTNAGDATVIVNGANSYYGDVSKTFKINPASIEGAVVTISPEEYTYTGYAVTPGVTVALGEKTLASGSEYKIACSDDTNAGDATVTITGTGNYTGDVSKTFKIKPYSIEGATITLEGGTVFSYTGNEIKPKVQSIQVGLWPAPLTTDDYDVTYSDNTNAGTATVTVVGKRNATGTATANFTITSKTVPTAADFTFTPPTDLVYTGSRINASLTTTKDMGTVTVEYKVFGITAEPVNSGFYAVVANVGGNDQYEACQVSDASWNYMITPKPLTVTAADQTIILGADIDPKAYSVNGLVDGHTLTATLSPSTDQLTDSGTITVNDDVKIMAGETDVTFNYNVTKAPGKLTITEPKPLTDAVVTVAEAGEYDGKAKTPAVTVKIGDTTLTKDKDYTLEYKDNVNAGTATVTVKGCGNYKGSQEETFTISHKPLTVKAADQAIILGADIDPKAYTAEGLVSGHTLTATLTPSTDKATDDGKITISGVKIMAGETDVTSNYKVTATDGKLIIIPESGAIEEGELKISLEKYSYEYNGSNIQPAVTVLLADTALKEGTDYELSYTNNKNAGKAMVSVTLKGSQSDEIRYLSFEITPRVIVPKVELSADKVLFNNKAQTPTVTVYDGSIVIDSGEYSVSYSNNTNVGTATVTVKDAPGGNYALKDAAAQFLIISDASYKITYGNGSGWVRNANYYLTLACDGDYSKFIGIHIDGIEVSTQFYSSYAGSTVVTLYPNLVGLLNNGWHSLTFNYVDGNATAVFYVGPPSINAPVTGDDSNIGLLVALICLGTIGSLSILPLLRKRNRG